MQIFSSTNDQESLSQITSQWTRSRDIETDADWTELEHVELATSPGGIVIVEFVSLESAAHQVKWLELARPAPGSTVRCATWCPELKACIDPLLWCDGVVDCPSKSDELPRQCQGAGSSNSARGWIFPKAYWYLVAAGSTLLVLFVIVSSVLVCRGNVHQHTKSRPADYDASNGELVTPVGGGISPVGGGSFRPPPVPIAPLNDYVHQGGLKRVASGASIGSGLVVGAPKPGILVDRSTAVYDKKLAVS